MYFLVTRLQGDYENFESEIKTYGFEVFHEPTLSITWPDITDKLKNYEPSEIDVIIFTSSNAARALATHKEFHHSKLIVVGEKTAQCAAECGFHNIQIIGPDVFAINDYFQTKNAEKHGKILYCAGSHITFDLKSALKMKSYDIEQITCYESQLIEKLSPQLIQRIKSGEVTAASFYSRRSAEYFISLIQGNGLTKYIKNINAFALSSKIADALGAILWNNIITAPAPNEIELVNSVREFYGQENR